MKHLFTTATFLAACCFLAGAQITVVSSSETFKTQSLQFKVVDDETQEPLIFASAYLIPKGDTLITHFTLSSTEGQVKIADVPRGIYSLNVEMLGYVPFRKEFSINSSPSIPQTIALKLDREFLEAATVTDFANPVEYLRDTIIYNAAAFNAGSNAMLEDLLMKMPGIEISEGKVSVNGKEVSEITVNGRTFFFGDQSLALSNLPARFIDKIKVIDKAGKKQEATGTRSAATDERVMDVELKEEFSKGNFGNLAAAAGAGQDRETDGSGSSFKALYDATLLTCLYNTEDQLTIVAQGNNLAPGDSRTSRLGANLNTDRLKGFETSLSVVATSSGRESESLSEETYFPGAGQSFTRKQSSIGNSKGLNLKTSMTVKHKDQSKFIFDLHPTVTLYSRQSISSRLAGTQSYSSSYDTDGQSRGLGIDGWLSTGINGIGKEGRFLKLYIEHDRAASDSDKDEISNIDYGHSFSDMELGYVTMDNSSKTQGTLSYGEPLAERLSLMLEGRVDYGHSESDIRATSLSDGSAAPGYSSSSNSRSLNFMERILLKFSLDNADVLAGGEVHQLSNMNESSSINGVFRSGQGEWSTGVSPYLQLTSKDYGKSLFFWTATEQVKGTQISPSLQMLSPTDMRIGNIYLRQQIGYNLTGQLSRYESKYHYSVLLSARIDDRPIVEANWFDANGVRYSFPVNSSKPGSSFNIFLNFSWRFGSNNRWQFFMHTNSSVRFDTGYQASSALPGPDAGNPDYDGFIKQFYGDSSGSIFYGGESGFRESNTRIMDIYGYIYLRYRTSAFSATMQVTPEYYGSRYSLVKAADRDVLRVSFSPSLNYTFPFGLYASTGLDCSLYRGYGKSIDRTVWDLSATLSKDIGMTTLSLECKDLLNDTMRLAHIASSEYYITTLSRSLGRTVLLKLTWSFGKGSSSHQRKANKFMDFSVQD